MTSLATLTHEFSKTEPEILHPIDDKESTALYKHHIDPKELLADKHHLAPKLVSLPLLR